MNKINKNNFFKFLLTGWISAFVFEEIPRIVFSIKHLWQLGKLWLPVFLLWYGGAFLIVYFVFRNRPLKQGVIFGIIFGMVVETFIFKKMNFVSFFLFPLLYGGMFYFPLKIYKNNEKKL